ncbi:MAG: hypothetical protein Tsb0010_14080 [Parvularculaceae bacterium]
MKTAVLTAVYLIGAGLAAIGVGRAAAPGLGDPAAWAALLRPLVIGYESALYWALEGIYVATGVDAPVPLADAALAGVISAVMIAPALYRGLALRQAAIFALSVALLLALNGVLGA